MPVAKKTGKAPKNLVGDRKILGILLGSKNVAGIYHTEPYKIWPDLNPAIWMGQILKNIAVVRKCLAAPEKSGQTPKNLTKNSNSEPETSS